MEAIFFSQLDTMLFGVFGPKLTNKSPCGHQLVNSNIAFYHPPLPMGRSLTFWSWCVLFLPQFFKNSLTCFWTQLTGIRIHLIIRMMDGWNQVFNDWSEEILNFFNSMCAPVHPQELKAEITVDENFNEYIRTTTTTGRCSSLATAVESRFALRRGSDLPPLNTTSCFIWCRSF